MSFRPDPKKFSVKMPKTGIKKVSEKKAVTDRVLAKVVALLKKKIKERFGQLRCEQCGEPQGKLHPHHIIYRSEKPNHPQMHIKENLFMVCPVCHRWYHEYKSRRNQLVAERGLDRIFGEDVLYK